MHAFDLPEATRALQSVARDFARDVLAPNARRWDEERHFPVAEMREAAALGMAALYVREESGGAGLTRLDAAVVFEALATGCPTVSAYLSIHNMVAWMIDRFGSDAQRAAWLPSLVTMERVASYALTEPGSGSDAAALRTRAARDNEGYVLNGTKQFISGAGESDLYLTMVRTGGEGPSGVSALLVPKETGGLSFGAIERKMGWNAQPTRQVIFEDARVPASALLGEEGQGFRFAMAGLDGGRLNIAACSLGGAEAALEIALDYTRQRQAFGRAVSDFQNTQFRLADMRTELEAARALLCLREARRRRARRHRLLRHGQALRHGHRVPCRRRCPAAARRLWLPGRLRHREAGARSARAPHPGRHQRDHAPDRGAKDARRALRSARRNAERAEKRAPQRRAR
jgi:hypothetical protein